MIVLVGDWAGQGGKFASGPFIIKRNSVRAYPVKVLQSLPCYSTEVLQNNPDYSTEVLQSLPDYSP